MSDFFSNQFVNHPCFMATTHVRQISAQFLRQHDLTHFSYIRTYDDGNQICLTTQPKMAHDYYQMGFHGTVSYEQDCLSELSSRVLWAAMTDTDNNLVDHYRQAYNVANGLNFIKRRTGFNEQFCFATTPENKAVNNFYLANINTLQNFCYYFIEQAKSLIQRLDSQRMIMPSSRTESLHTNNCLNNSNSFPLAIENPAFKKLYYRGDYKHYITVREFQCLQLMAKGMGIKLIAAQLNLAERTVKSYLDNLKNKLNLNNKMELINFFYQLI